MKRFIRWTAFVLIAAFGLIQFVPAARTNPPVEAEISAPPEVRAILRASCYDCHSNETVWPWYSRVAPFSWLLASHVREGREELNFSAWANYPPERRAEKLGEIGEEVDMGKMPMPQYLWAHPRARLSPEQKAALLAWAQTQP